MERVRVGSDCMKKVDVCTTLIALRFDAFKDADAVDFERILNFSRAANRAQHVIFKHDDKELWLSSGY